MKKPLKKILDPKNKNFARDFENTDFGESLNVDDLHKVNFALQGQDKLITLRVSSNLLALLKMAAAKHKTRYQKLMRLILEQEIVAWV